MFMSHNLGTLIIQLDIIMQLAKLFQLLSTSSFICFYSYGLIITILGLSKAKNRVG